MVGHFLKHEPCPKCGSKDNLGRYQDGSAYCFGCGHYEQRDGRAFNPRKIEEDGKSTSTFEGVVSSMEDNILGVESVEWLGKYGISAEDAIKYGWRWNPRSKQLLFPLRNEWDDIVCLQARNFDPERASQAKYFNWGNKSVHFNLFKSNVWWREDSVVLTEDVLSSVKISKAGVDAFPLLGTSISKNILAMLAIYYEELFVWLDYDKYKEAMDIQRMAQFLGMEAHVVLTTKDPKCYNTEEIRGYIRSLHDI